MQEQWDDEELTGCYTTYISIDHVIRHKFAVSKNTIIVNMI